jgi:small conductance mechanosensitive channel
MGEAGPHFGFVRELTWNHAALILAVLVGGRLIVVLIRLIVRRAAESAPSHRRLLILRTTPIVRLLVGITSIALIVPILVEPTFEEVAALVATIGLALAFALKDYVSCLVAGVVTILEHTYQPGDWIEVDGSYGEVTAIGTRAVHIVTADDTEVIIPHARLWTTSIHNASGGKRSLLCVAEIYLQADHDGGAVLQTLAEVAEASRYRKPETPVKIVAAEMPWGTRYKIKAYVNESREQFAMITDLTISGKERLRAMGLTFAQAAYAEGASR